MLKVEKIEGAHSEAMSMVVSELVVVQKAQALKEAQATELKLQLVSAQAKVTILMCHLALLLQPYHALAVLVLVGIGLSMHTPPSCHSLYSPLSALKGWLVLRLFHCPDKSLLSICLHLCSLLDPSHRHW